MTKDFEENPWEEEDQPSTYDPMLEPDSTEEENIILPAPTQSPPAASMEEENINQSLSPTPAAIPRSSSDMQISPNLNSPDISPVKSLPQSNSTRSPEEPVVKVRNMDGV